jgi:hypothetical protein
LNARASSPTSSRVVGATRAARSRSERDQESHAQESTGGQQQIPPRPGDDRRRQCVEIQNDLDLAQIDLLKGHARGDDQAPVCDAAPDLVLLHQAVVGRDAFLARRGDRSTFGIDDACGDHLGFSRDRLE